VSKSEEERFRSQAQQLNSLYNINLSTRNSEYSPQVEQNQRELGSDCKRLQSTYEVLLESCKVRVAENQNITFSSRVLVPQKASSRKELSLWQKCAGYPTLYLATVFILK